MQRLRTVLYTSVFAVVGGGGGDDDDGILLAWIWGSGSGFQSLRAVVTRLGFNAL